MQDARPSTPPFGSGNGHGPLGSAPAAGEGHENRADNGEDQLAGVLREVRSDFASMAREAKTIARVRAARVGLALRESAFGLALAAFAGLAGLVITLVGAVVLVLGMSGGFSALFGGAPWAGRLATGLVIIGGGVALLLYLRAQMRRAFLETLERRFGSGRDEPSPSSAKE